MKDRYVVCETFAVGVTDSEAVKESWIAEIIMKISVTTHLRGVSFLSTHDTSLISAVESALLPNTCVLNVCRFRTCIGDKAPS